MTTINTRKQAINRLIAHSTIIKKNMYFHPFKYEIEGLIDEFVHLEKRVATEKLKEIYFCIGFLKADKRYQQLDWNDFAR